MNTHRDLQVWKIARQLVLTVYQFTAKLPKDERFVCVSQLRAAWSVQNNIAEGNAKRGNREMRRFFDIALGSLAEVDSMIATLPDIYETNSDVISGIEGMRRAITCGIFKIIKRHAR